MGKYGLFEETIKAGNGVAAAYGVVLPDGERVGDITFSKQSAERLVGLLNENEVELCHARDVIEDYIFNETTLEIKYYGE